MEIETEEFSKDFETLIYKSTSVSKAVKPKLHLKNTEKYFPDFLSGNTAVLIVSEKVKIFIEQSLEASYVSFIEAETKPRDIKLKYLLSI